MRLKRTETIIACPKCFQVVGTVYAYQDPKRLGFWANESQPEKIPHRCSSCNVQVQRIPQQGKEVIIAE